MPTVLACCDRRHGIVRMFPVGRTRGRLVIIEPKLVGRGRRSIFRQSNTPHRRFSESRGSAVKFLDLLGTPPLEKFQLAIELDTDAMRTAANVASALARTADDILAGRASRRSGPRRERRHRGKLGVSVTPSWRMQNQRSCPARLPPGTRKVLPITEPSGSPASCTACSLSRGCDPAVGGADARRARAGRATDARDGRPRQ